MGEDGYKLSEEEMQKLVPHNRALLRLMGGFVEMPRTWNVKNVIACIVNKYCGYPEPQTVSHYLRAREATPEVSTLRDAVQKRIMVEFERICKSEWVRIMEHPVDVTRTDRRGRYLPRSV